MKRLSIVAACLLLTLAACNQSGRPAPQPYIGPDQAALNAQMGQVVDGAYVVANGDSLAIVSERTNTPIRTLIDLNNLQPPYLIAPGQRLALHQRSHYVVQSGDTVSGLSKKLGVTQSALIQLNNLKSPYALKIGQTLNLPSQIEASNDPAPAPAASPSGDVSQAALPPLPGTTVSAAPAAPATTAPAASSSTTSAPIAATPNGAPKPQAGSKPLVAPDAPAVPDAQPEPVEPAVTSMPSADSPPIPSTSAPQPSATQTAAEPAASPPPAPQPSTTQTAAVPAASPAPAPAAPAKPAVTVMKPTGSGKFGWPVQGKVIGKFGGGSDGLKNDGINIAAPVGAPVNAAADGVVAYAGNQLRGFGNMILIRHADGYVTAYAHNQSLLVEKGAKVKRGQTIARVGSTGNVGSPQLHFEIRKGTEPVDPLTMLGG